LISAAVALYIVTAAGVTDETLREFNSAQYVEGYDACTREVTECLQSQNLTVSSPHLYTGLLTHLASRRRRLILARRRHHQHVLPPAECIGLFSDSNDENANSPQTAKVLRQIRAVAGEESRSPLLSIANVQPGSRPTDETSTKTKLAVECTCDEQTQLTSPSVDVCRHTDYHGVRDDTVPDSDSDCVLSLETDDDMTSPMWRPW